MTMTRALLLTTAAVSRRLPPWKSSVLANFGVCRRYDLLVSIERVEGGACRQIS